MRCSQLVLFALPLVGLAQGVALRRDNDGHEKHYEHNKDASKCEPEKVYVTAPPEKHYVTKHEVQYKTVEGPVKYVTKIEHKEGPTQYVTKHEVKTDYVTKTEHPPTKYVTKLETAYETKTEHPPTKYVTKHETAYVTKTKEAEKVYVTQPAKVEYKYKTVTVAPSPKCTVTAKPAVWPQPKVCKHGKDMYGDKCDEKAPAPTTYAHWDYKPEHCYTTWDNKYEPTRTDEHKPKETQKDEHKPKETAKDGGKKHDDKDGKDADGKEHR